MGYNQNCNYQNCTYRCCNYNGDCPEWYSNQKWQYTECYYYYGVDPTTLIWTTVCTIVGIIVLAIIAFCCYRQYKKKQMELLKQDRGEFQISNVTLDTKADAVLPKIQSTSAVSPEHGANIKKKGPMVPYGQPIDLNKTQAIYGIGATQHSEI